VSLSEAAMLAGLVQLSLCGQNRARMRVPARASGCPPLPIDRYLSLPSAGCLLARAPRWQERPAHQGGGDRQAGNFRLRASLLNEAAHKRDERFPSRRSAPAGAP
jgi:hypothetical protein